MRIDIGANEDRYWGNWGLLGVIGDRETDPQLPQKRSPCAPDSKCYHGSDIKPTSRENAPDYPQFSQNSCQTVKHVKMSLWGN